GRVHMTVNDLLTYLAAHRDRTSLLSAESWNTLHTPPFGGDYALGWMVRRNSARWHNGSNTLWYAEAQFDPTSGIAAAAVSNDGVVVKSAPEVARALLAAAGAV